VKLGDLVTVRTGKLDANASVENGEYPFFTCAISSLRIDRFAFDGKAVLVAGNGDLNVKYYEGKFNAYQRTYVVQSKDENKLLPRYLAAFLEQYLEPLRSLSIGGVIKYIRLGNLTDALIPLPPIEEQQSIAALLGLAAALKVKRRAAASRLSNLTQAVFCEWFGDPIINPKSYLIRPLIDIVDSERPITYGILKPGPDQLRGPRYVRVLDMKGGRIDSEGTRRTTDAIALAYERSVLRPNDLLLSIRGHVGRLAVVPPDLDGANITQDTARLAIKGADPMFVLEYLRTTSMQAWMKRHTKGGAVQGINLGDVKRIPVMLPPKGLQKEFARKALAIEMLQPALEKSLAKVDALYGLLQERAFRRRLTPRGQVELAELAGASP